MADPRNPDQRDMLERSEAEAAAEHPKTFRPEATDEKVVEIGNDKRSDPIQGIDPPERRPGQGDNRLDH